MKRIALISCVKQKLPYKARAEDLYTSDLFRKHLAYAKQLAPDAIYILSPNMACCHWMPRLSPTTRR
jgi:hypothetical protein